MMFWPTAVRSPACHGERTKFKAYLIYAIVISGLVFPISASWVWGGGFLSGISVGNAVGFVDFAGSSLVHMVGGIAALVGAKIVGPRVGKYTRDGKIRAIPGHSIPLGALGVFI
jgi:Amt family ammonium transporter